MTKEHGLVGKYLKMGPVEDKAIYEMAKSFAEQVSAKIKLQVKHGSEDIQRLRFTILNRILGVGVEARVDSAH